MRNISPWSWKVALCQQKANTSSSAPADLAGLYISSWGQDLSGDSAGNKIHHQMLKCSIGTSSWWIIWKFPDLCQWRGGLHGYHLCAGRWLTLTLTHHLFPLADFSGTFPHKLTAKIVFLALLHPFSRDSVRHKTGKENHPQPNRAVAPRTTRCPSITNYLFPLIHSVTLPRAKLQSFPPVPTTSLAKANAHVLWELANHCQLLGSGVSASIATGQSPQGHCGTLCWQGGANPISPRHSWAGLCRRAQTVPEAEDKRTYLVMQWGPSPHSRKKHQLQTSSPLSQPPLPLSPVKEKERELQLKGTMGLKAQDQTWGLKDSFAWHT